jgi:hypothetical protein
MGQPAFTSRIVPIRSCLFHIETGIRERLFKFGNEDIIALAAPVTPRMPRFFFSGRRQRAILLTAPSSDLLFACVVHANSTDSVTER